MALYNNGNFATRDGVVSSGSKFTSFDINGGSVKMAGTSEGLRTVLPQHGLNINPVMEPRDGVGAAQYTSATNVSAVASGGNGVNNLTTLRVATGSPHGLSAGQHLFLTDTSGIIAGPTVIRSIESTTGFVVNKPYSASIGTVTYALQTGTFANMEIGNYSMRKVAGNVHGLTSNILTAGASDYGRNAVARIFALRTRKVATAIRAGYWNPFTGQFTTDPSLANDYTSMDNDGSNIPDDEAKNIIAGYGVGGEFSYRNGTRNVVSGEYDRKTT